MKKFFVSMMILALLTGCSGVNINNNSTEVISKAVESEEKNTMNNMKDFTNSVVKDFTQDYSLPLDSIIYSYNEENDKHDFKLKHDSQNGVESHYINDKFDKSKTIRVSSKGEAIPEEILKNMDKIFDRAFEDFNKKFNQQKNIHFKHWNLHDDNGKYIFNGIVISDEEHSWDIYYNVEKDIGIK